MLRFSKPPDAVFQAILRKSLEYAIDVISDLLQVCGAPPAGAAGSSQYATSRVLRRIRPGGSRGISSRGTNHDDTGTRQEFTRPFPEAGRVFPPSAAKATLTELRKCLDRPEVYICTDYHNLLLYAALNFYADIHNGLVIKASNRRKRKEASFVDPFYIEKINIDEIIEMYFFDRNFLLDAGTLLEIPDSVRKTMRPELFGVCQGLQPHPEEMELKIDTGLDRDLYRVQASEFFGPESKEYPDFGYYDVGICR